ncbi:MAG: hypothetical protein GXO25_02820 [Euryarchaeota archaeon]|nr:hypothetical protein [Euryarchaeota archaeon]
MRVSIMKGMNERMVAVVKSIYAYEEKYGAMNYHSKKSSNGIAWKPGDAGVSRKDLAYLLNRGIVEEIASGVYHIAPKLRGALAGELEMLDAELEVKFSADKAIEYALHGNMDARALLDLLKFQKKWSAMYDDIGWKLSKAKEIIINAGADLTLLNRLREAGLVYQVADDEYLLREFPEELLSAYLEGSFSTQDAVFEYRNIVMPMKQQFLSFISSLSSEDIDEMLAQVRDVWDIVNYTKHVMGSLYMDALLPVLQQYGMADVPVFSTEGRKITQTGFSLAYFGEPGTGKTFTTDDFLRGNEKNGIPAHGIIGRLRYGEGMTPKKFIAILEAYQNYPVDWIIPEFNDFFRYRGMVEKLKLVMEQREVSDETKKEVIKPYRVRSFFIVNYNTRSSGGRWNVTIEDPNFNAIEDRMICKVFVNSEEREKAIYENMVRRVSGDIEWYLSKYLRMHITYAYHVFHENPSRVVLSTSDFVDFGNKVREIRRKLNVNVSNRVILKGIQIAGSAALVGGVREPGEIRISSRDLELALEFIREELNTRAKKK